MELEALPFDVTLELEGWSLFWALLERRSDPESAGRLAELRERCAEAARRELELSTLTSHPTLDALRALFRAAGTDPSRYRPSSEALARRVLKGEEIPAISPLVDLNNCLSLELLVPCCVMDAGALEPPFRFRRGAGGESYASLRGPFRLEGRPLLVDEAGPADAPITGSERVKVSEQTRSAWLVGYLPAERVRPATVAETLERLLDHAPVATVRTAGAVPAGS
jgi:DNA/RNA-binding domain of Phe-tRNA-synthetase-like protein